MVPVSLEQNDARAAVRRALYVEMYGRPSYDWIKPSGVGEDETSLPHDYSRYDNVSSSSLPENERKPYIPPTEIIPESGTPFGDKIGPPLN